MLDSEVRFFELLANDGVLGIGIGDDGLVKVVTVRTKNSVFKRPIVELCPLPSNEISVLEDQQPQDK